MEVVSKNEVWFTFAGVLDTQVTRSVFTIFANAIKDGISTVHFLIHSPGGNVNDGIALFNYFDSIPIELVAYNSGSVASAAAIAYLGAHKRIVCESGAFMIHHSTGMVGNVATGKRLQSVVDSLHIDDARLMNILNSRIKLTDEQQGILAVADLHLDAKQSVECGIAHEIGQFIPKGPLYNI